MRWTARSGRLRRTDGPIDTSVSMPRRVKGLRASIGFRTRSRSCLRNLLRNHQQGRAVSTGDRGDARTLDRTRGTGGAEIAYHPTRIITPDSSGIPLLADLAAMRDAMVDLGGDPKLINPLSAVDFVVDHSAMVDVQGRPDAAERNSRIEYERNGERYEFLRWAQQTFSNLRVVPPGHGIIHQINLEYLAQCVLTEEGRASRLSRHRARHGQPHADDQCARHSGLGMRRARGRRGDARPTGVDEHSGRHRRAFHRRTSAGVTSTDLVLTVTKRLRKKGVVQKFVEYCGPGLASLPMATRATIANMAPEYGATVGFFPIDGETLRYLRQTGRPGRTGQSGRGVCPRAGAVAIRRAEPVFTDVVEIDSVRDRAERRGPEPAAGSSWHSRA